MGIVDLLSDQATKRQQYLEAILASDSPRKLIFAGPGTGKTYTFRRLFQSLPPGNKLALTFIRNFIGGKIMAIMAIFTGKGFTKDMYDRLRQEVAWETEPIDGWVMHAVGFDESGELHMINIWESIDKMQEGFVSRLMPVMQKIGIPAPRAEVYPAYNLKVFKTTI